MVVVVLSPTATRPCTRVHDSVHGRVQAVYTAEYMAVDTIRVRPCTGRVRGCVYRPCTGVHGRHTTVYTAHARVHDCVHGRVHDCVHGRVQAVYTGVYTKQQLSNRLIVNGNRNNIDIFLYI